MNQSQRDEFLERSRAHRAADMLAARTYGNAHWGEWRGCSIGCHLFDMGIDPDNGHVHAVIAKHYGYPEWLAGLQDEVFEGLSDPDRLDWHVQFAEALHGLPDDYDWDRARSRVLIAILKVALPHAGSSDGVVRQVIALHERVVRGDAVSDDDWSAAGRAALRGAHSALALADAAAEAAATASALWSPEDAAASVADAAEEAAASAAWSAEGAEGSMMGAASKASYATIRDGVLAALKEGATT